ncbi:MAG: MATE family efflux transporter [Ruminococcaceae bacterium]|nr:MATE family efflux transporter [Oscillospiraceae bacterium]
MTSIKKLFAPTDMTKGVPWKSIVAFTLPMLIGNIAQQLYNTVDSIVVSHYIKDSADVIAANINNPDFVKAGDRALSAVGSCGPILNMLLVLFIGISAGASIMVSQYFGAKNRKSLSFTVGNCITVTAIACIILIAVMTPLIRPLLVVLNTPASTLDWCCDYLTISLIGIMGMAYYNILSGIIRGLGDSFSALLYLLVATILNIILDIFFVANLNMEVAGVALATVIAQCVSSALCLWKLSRMQQFFDFKLSYLKPVGEYVMRIIKLGLPSGLTQAIFSSAMIIVQSLTNSFGELFIAANVVIMRVDGFAMMPNFSFGTAMTTYAGQNVGAGDYDRVSKGAKQGTLIAVGTSALITAIILLFGKPLMGVFTETAELVDMSYYLMMILATGYIAMAVTQSLSGIMRGAGDTVTPMWVSLCTTVLARVPIAYGISFLTRTPELPHGRYECIQISLLISWVLGAVLTSIFYARGKWKNKAITKQ